MVMAQFMSMKWNHSRVAAHFHWQKSSAWLQRFGWKLRLLKIDRMHMLFRAAICPSELRAAMRPAESWLKGPPNSGSSWFSLFEGFSNVSLNKWVPLLFSGGAATCLHPYAAFVRDRPAHFFEVIPENIMCTCEKCSFFVFFHVIVHADSSNLNDIRKGNNYTMGDFLIFNEVWLD